MNHLSNYFNELANLIESSSKMAGGVNHPTSIGDNREIIVQNFLEKHLPNRFDIKIGGTIFNNEGRESGQIDVIVSNELGLNFKEHGKMFHCIESVAAAISVKSDLTKEKLFDCLEEFSNIPQPSLEVIKDYDGGNESGMFIEKYPALIIFAFTGLSADTIRNHMYNFYAEKLNSNIRENRVPHMVVVNKEYVIVAKKYYMTGNNNLTFDILRLDTTNQGQPFAGIIGLITQYNTYINVLEYEFAKYFNKNM